MEKEPVFPVFFPGQSHVDAPLTYWVPQIGIKEILGPVYTKNKTITWEIVPKVPLTHISYRIKDLFDWKTIRYKGSIRIAIPREGRFELEVIPVVNGDKGAVFIHEFIIDRTGPNLSISGIPSITNKKSIEFTIEYIDEYSKPEDITFHYRINGGTLRSFSVIGNQAVIHNLPQGQLQIDLFCRDGLGNTGNIITKNIVIDLAPPTIAIECPNLTNNVRPVIRWTGKDSMSNPEAIIYEFSCDGDSFIQTLQTEFVPATALGEGLHVFRLRAKDSAGNWSRISELKFTIDTTPPEIISIDFPNPSNSTKPVITMLAKDNLNRKKGLIFKCSIDNNEWESLTKGVFIPRNDLAEGTHSFKVYAIDKAGNSSPIYERSLSIDISSPQITGITLVYPEDPSKPPYYQWACDDPKSSEYSIKISTDTTSTAFKTTLKTFTLPAPFRNIAHTFEISTRDKAGNASYTYINDFVHGTSIRYKEVLVIVPPGPSGKNIALAVTDTEMPSVGDVYRGIGNAYQLISSDPNVVLDKSITIQIDYPLDIDTDNLFICCKKENDSDWRLTPPDLIDTDRRTVSFHTSSLSRFALGIFKVTVNEKMCTLQTIGSPHFNIQTDADKTIFFAEIVDDNSYLHSRLYIRRSFIDKSNTVSFESERLPGYYLRVTGSTICLTNSNIYLANPKADPTFKQDASFFCRPGQTDFACFRFESCSNRQKYLQNIHGSPCIDYVRESDSSDAANATFTLNNNATALLDLTDVPNYLLYYALTEYNIDLSTINNDIDPHQKEHPVPNFHRYIGDVEAANRHFFIKTCYDVPYYHGAEAVAADNPTDEYRIVIWKGDYDLSHKDHNPIALAAYMLWSLYSRNNDPNDVGYFGAGAEICIYKKRRYTIDTIPKLIELIPLEQALFVVDTIKRELEQVINKPLNMNISFPFGNNALSMFPDCSGAVEEIADKIRNFINSIRLDYAILRKIPPLFHANKVVLYPSPRKIITDCFEFMKDPGHVREIHEEFIKEDWGQWRDVKHDCPIFVNRNHDCMQLIDVSHICPLTPEWKDVWHFCNPIMKPVPHFCDGQWQPVDHLCEPRWIDCDHICANNYYRLTKGCGNTGIPHQVFASEWTKSCFKSGVPHQMLIYPWTDSCKKSGPPHEALQPGPWTIGCGNKDIPHQIPVPANVIHCGHKGIPHQEPKLIQNTINCGLQGWPHQELKLASRISCGNAFWPHQQWVWNSQPSESVFNPYRVLDKILCKTKQMETFKNDFFADHYMPYSLSNFEEVDTPIVEFVIVSKVNKTLNGEKINKGDIIVRDKLKTWWLNCWTGSKGKGQELQWYEMAMFFRISGFYNDKWMIWENNGTPEDPKRQTGGWGNQKEFIFVDIC